MSKVAPFIMRAHHIQLFTEAQASSPAEVTQKVLTHTKVDRADATAATVDFSNVDEDPRTYGVDVLGDTIAQEQRYAEGLLSTLKEFQELPDGAPVRIGVGILDGICNSCAFKNHCRTDLNRQYDIGVLAVKIEETAIEIGYMDRIAVTLQDDNPEHKQFDTDAGTVRAIMQCLNYGFTYDSEGNAFPANPESDSNT